MVAPGESPREAGDRILRPYRARKYLLLIQGWRDLRSLTPGYPLQPLRGWPKLLDL